MTPEDERQLLRDLEVTRTSCLVRRDMEAAERLHAEDYALVTPRGVSLDKREYLAAVASGALTYRRFEPVSEIDVLLDRGSVAVLRYQSALDVESGAAVFSETCWHIDCYRRHPEHGWQAVWSQATRCRPPSGDVGAVEAT